MLQDDENYDRLEKVAGENGYEIYKISAVTGEGLDKLFARIAELLKDIPKEEFEIEETTTHYTLDDEPDFVVRRDGKYFIVEGKEIEKIMRRVNFSDNESLSYFHLTLRKIGVDSALKKQCIKEGDIVKIFDWEFEYEE